MSKHETLLRHQKIITKLRNHGNASFEEINDYLFNQSELLEYKLTISKRTFQRDLIEIRSLYNIDIQFDRSRNTYHIAEEDTEAHTRLMEAFDMVSALKMSEDLTSFICFEKRKPRGTQHLYGLLHAIRNRLVIHLNHQSFHSDQPKLRFLEPFGLKESRGRWYLIANDTKEEQIKSFGLDRIIDFEITKKRFVSPDNFDISEHFKYSFGIIRDSESDPIEVILSFDAWQGKFIKAYPFHESQTILVDNESELRIQLFLWITQDFIMELLSYAERVKVHSPDSLRKELAEHQQKALRHHQGSIK